MVLVLPTEHLHLTGRRSETHDQSVFMRCLEATLGLEHWNLVPHEPWWPPSEKSSAPSRWGPCRAQSAICLHGISLGREGGIFCPCFFRALVNGISLFAVERENVQKRTFTRWINLHLEKASGGLGAGE